MFLIFAFQKWQDFVSDKLNMEITILLICFRQSQLTHFKWIMKMFPAWIGRCDRIIGLLVCSYLYKCILIDLFRVDQTVIFIPIRTPKVKNHWLWSVITRVIPLNWSVKGPKTKQNEFLVNLWLHKILDFANKSKGYKNGGTISSMADHNYDSHP